MTDLPEYEDLFFSNMYTLHEAAEHDEMDRLTALLDTKDINQGNLAGNTPLHYAVAYKHQAIVALLLTRGAKINLRELENS